MPFDNNHMVDEYISGSVPIFKFSINVDPLSVCKLTTYLETSEHCTLANI